MVGQNCSKSPCAHRVNVPRIRVCNRTGRSPRDRCLRSDHAVQASLTRSSVFVFVRVKSQRATACVLFGGPRRRLDAGSLRERPLVLLQPVHILTELVREVPIPDWTPEEKLKASLLRASFVLSLCSVSSMSLGCLYAESCLPPVSGVEVRCLPPWWLAWSAISSSHCAEGKSRSEKTAGLLNVTCQRRQAKRPAGLRSPVAPTHQPS